MHTDALPLLKADEYPGGLWYYEPHTYQPYRYVLGRVGRHPLVCIGIITVSLIYGRNGIRKIRKTPSGEKNIRLYSMFGK